MKKIIIGLIILGYAGFAVAEAKDSIGQKTVNGKNYVLYKVEAKETLYSLSKKYNTTVDEIKTANDGLAAGLQKGATIMIPSKSVVVSKPKIESVQAMHVVGDGETLYSISKKYNVSVDDIKKWNKLESNAISKGQELKVSQSSQATATVGKVISGGGSGASIPLSQDKALAKNDPDAAVATTPDLTYSKVAPGAQGIANPIKREDYTIDTSLYGEEVTETKTINKISEIGIDQSKNLAQMKGVKVGTILMIVNPANNKATFVRVIDGDSKEAINVTNSVLTALNLSTLADAKVKVSYTK